MKPSPILAAVTVWIFFTGYVFPAAALTVSYTHDDAGRLVQVVYGDKTIDYTYDKAGNLLNREVTAATPGSLQFSTAAFSVNESGGNGSVTVTRTGSSDGAASVTAATSDGTAVAGVGYTAVNTVVNWADGDSTDKIVQVPITDNWATDGDRTINLVLQNLTAATLGSPDTAVLTIVDDDVHSDGDNVPDAVEDAAPNGGDGNNDGQPDSDQAHVVSLQNAGDGNYATIASSDDTTVVTVQTTNTPPGPNQPQDAIFSCGYFTITVTNVTPGSCVEVTLYLYNATDITTYYKYNPNEPDSNNRWYEFSHDGTTGATITQEAGYIRVVLDLCDGARGDYDSVPGIITDPGGPAERTVAPPIPTLTEWGTLLLILTMAVLSLKGILGRQGDNSIAGPDDAPDMRDRS